MPWDFHPELLYRGPSWWLIALYIFLGVVGGSALGFIVAMRTSKRFNKRVRESAFFQSSSLLWDHASIRKSLALPDSLSEVGYNYEEEVKGAAEEAFLLGKQESNSYS